MSALHLLPDATKTLNATLDIKYPEAEALALIGVGGLHVLDSFSSVLYGKSTSYMFVNALSLHSILE